MTMLSMEPLPPQRTNLRDIAYPSFPDKSIDFATYSRVFKDITKHIAKDIIETGAIYYLPKVGRFGISRLTPRKWVPNSFTNRYTYGQLVIPKLVLVKKRFPYYWHFHATRKLTMDFLRGIVHNNVNVHKYYPL